MASESLLGERRDQARAGDTTADAEGNPAGATGHTSGRGHDDADDQPRLQDFAKDDEQAGQHAAILDRLPTAVIVPLAVLAVFADEAVFPGFSGPAVR